MFKVLHYGLEREREMRGLFKKVLELTRHQNTLSEEQVKDMYLRPWDKRKEFSLKSYPKYLPFELFAYLRTHYLKVIDGLSENDVLQYMSDNIFKFDDEFVLNHVNVLNKWDLIYILFNPQSSIAVRMFFQQMFGAENDYIPIMHPKRFP